MLVVLGALGNAPLGGPVVLLGAALTDGHWFLWGFWGGFLAGLHTPHTMCGAHIWAWFAVSAQSSKFLFVK